MKNKFLFLQITLFILSIWGVGDLHSQIRRKPITPDLNTGGLPQTAPTNNTPSNNDAPATLPPIVIKQENERKEVVIRKPEKGDFTVEGLLQLSFGEAPIMLRFPEIKGRFFAANNLAYRGTVGFEIGSQTSDFTDNRQTASYVVSQQSIRAGGGVELHIKSSKRISPYYGAEGLILVNSNKITGTNTDDLKTYTLGGGYQKDSSFTGIYLGALAGLDYYLSSDIYMGFELGVGVTSFSTTVVGERKTLRGTTISESNVVSGRGNSIGIRYSPGIRVGFKF